MSEDILDLKTDLDSWAKKRPCTRSPKMGSGDFFPVKIDQKHKMVRVSSKKHDFFALSAL